mmetsp:Transcript_55383/g.64773  ORF Transcript_55383/g.64773 Transcript_55383/m.64773 type:complete len:157 (-) Transcript_55383:311-781(-)
MGSSQSFPIQTRTMMKSNGSNNRSNHNNDTKILALSPSSAKTSAAGTAPAATSVDEAIVDALQNMPKMHKVETFEEKLYRKFSQEPFIPIGCVLTTYCLVSGIKSFMDRDAARSQLMMRGRVVAQTSTIVAFMVYAGWENLDFFKPKDLSDYAKKE